jgi:amino acid adenylation domain-containing protein
MSEGRPTKESLKEQFKEQAKAHAKGAGKQLKEILRDLSPDQRDLLLRRITPKEKTSELRRRAETADAPLTFAQEREWFRHCLFPDVARNISGALRLTGPLSLDALQAACDGIVLRHDTLRATFHAADGAPVQKIADAAPLPIEVLDLSEAEWRHRYTDEITRPFNLTRDRLLRVTLLRLAPDAHVLLLTMHHIVSDGWSIGILTRELSELYNAAVESREPRLPALPVRYADVAAWQRERTQGGALDPGLAWWREFLGDPERPLELPADTGDAAARAHHGATATARIERALKHDLERLSREEEATLFVTLLTAFLTLLMRCTGRDDLLVGTPVSGRTRVEAEGLIGLFLNTLALRVRLAPDLTFRDAMRVVRTAVLGAMDHADVPIERIVQQLGLAGTTDAQPLYETVFNFTPAVPRRIDLTGLEVKLEDPPALVVEFSTQLFVSEWAGALELDLRYRRQRYSEPRMATFLAQYVGVLEQVVRDADRPLAALDLTTARCRTLLPDPTVPLEMPPQRDVPQCLADWIARTPEAIAIQQGTTTLTYAGLGEQMAAIVERLHGAGFEPGDVVAVSGDRTPDTIVSMCATLAAGGVLLTLSPDLPEHRREVMLEQAGTRFILRTASVSPAAPQASHLRRQKEAAYIFFTSGSTGTPKGVLGTHAGLAHWLNWQRETFAVAPGDRSAQLTGLSFDVVLRDVFLPLTSGATLVLPEADDTDTLRWLEREQITLLHTVPAVADVWLRGNTGNLTLPTLRHVFFAGEPLTASLVQRWRVAFPSAEVINVYGPTETTLAKCFYRVPPTPRAGIQPVGTTLPQTQALVLTPEGALCGLGEPGEIAIRTPFRSLGYINAAGTSFIPNPFREDPDDVVYLTGDRGVYGADGVLEIRGRIDDQVKIRGVRVEPSEVAAALRESREVASCAVVAHEDDEGVMLVAYVVLEPGAHEDVARLRDDLARRLPAAMIPSAFVFLDALPLTPNGKVDRARLPEPERVRANGSRYVAPRNPTELQLVQVWEELLAVRPIGVTDRFFEIGGHSLLALRLLADVEKRFGRKVPLPALLEEPTVEHLAAVLRGTAEAWPLLIKLREASHGRKLFLVHPGGGMLWNYMHLIRYLPPDIGVYGIQARGLDGLAAPHESLETMAADYIAEMRAVQPEGPYLLAGHSFGGVIAFEMAQQLLHDNGEIAFLGMFDSVAPLSRAATEPADERREDALRLTQMAGVIGRFLGEEVAVSYDDLCRLETDEQVERVVAALKDTRALPPGDEQRLLRNLLKVNKAHLRAHRAYQPRALAVPITLFRVESTHPADYPAAGEELLRHESLGWATLTTAAVNVVPAQGSHVTMLSSTHAEALAHQLTPWLAV